MSHADRDQSGKRFVSPDVRWLGTLFGLVFPTIVTLVYFVWAAGAGETAQRATMLVMKTIQFAFPVVWTMWVLGERIGLPRLTFAGIPSGLLFGFLVCALGGIVFHHHLQVLPAFTDAGDKIRAKIAGFGLDSTVKFAALGVFYSLVHSLMEEYYWRWFVFGQLRRLVPLWAAIVVSSLGFMSHHVIILATYFGWFTWPTVLLSLAVAVGGGFWAWLYDRSGSLLGPWLSHLLIDAGIFILGFQMFRTVLVSVAP